MSFTYSCERRYHGFDPNFNRDASYRETSGRWTNCTNVRCPLRYNTKEIPDEINKKGYLVPEISQEKKIFQTYPGPYRDLIRNPATAGSVASPRIPSSSFHSPAATTPTLPSPLEPIAKANLLQLGGRSSPHIPEKEPEPQADKPDSSEESESEDSDEEPSTKDKGKNKANEPEIRNYTYEDFTKEFVRQAVPSFMSATAAVTTTESISSAHRYAFPGGISSSGGGQTVPVATATSGGVVTSGGTTTTTTGGGGTTTMGSGGPTTTSSGGTAATSSSSTQGVQGSNPGSGPGGGNPGSGPGGGNPGSGPRGGNPGGPPHGGPPPGNVGGNQGIPPAVPQGKGKIKDPEVFNGDRSKTRSFLNQLFLLFTARPQDFPNDHTKVATALSFMEGDNINYWKDTAIRRAEEEVQPGIPRGFDTWAVFKQNFQSSFAPVDEVDNSMVNLTTIQLRDYSSVDEFNARFMDLAIKGNIVDPTSQLALYRQALPEYLLKKIALSYPAPSTIAEWMTRTKEIDHNYQLTEKILANRRTRKAKVTRKTIKAINAEEDTEAKVNRLSETERKDLQSKGLCFRCRKGGHISRNCPSKAKDRNKLNTKQIRKFSEEDLEDSEGETGDKEDSDNDLEINAQRATDFNSDF